MTRKRLVAASIVASGLVGAAAGYALSNLSCHVANLVGANFASLYYQDRAAILRVEVEELQRLRRGEVSSVIDTLETRVDLGLASISTYHDNVPASFPPHSFYKDVAAVRNYRADHPSPLPDGAVRDAAQKALALRPDDETQHQ